MCYWEEVVRRPVIKVLIEKDELDEGGLWSSGRCCKVEFSVRTCQDPMDFALRLCCSLIISKMSLTKVYSGT